MTTTALTRRRSLLDRPNAPRVVLTATTLLLLVVPLTTPEDGVWVLAHLLGALAFCAWIWTPMRWRHPFGLVLSAALLVAGVLEPAPGIDILTIAGLTTALRSIGLRWGLLTIAALGLVSATRVVEGSDLMTLSTSGAQSLLVVFVLVLLDRTACATRELEVATHELAEPVDHERAMLTDRLGSLIGRTLVAAREAVRGTVAVADRADPGVLAQLHGIEALLEDGITQLEKLIIEPVAETLEGELEATRDVCERLGIAATVSADAVPDPVIADMVALVLREAVTNMLKHADATRCVVAVRVDEDATVLAVTNDGAAPVATSSGSSRAGTTGATGATGSRVSTAGTGQRRWREALAGHDAELTTSTLSDGRYQVWLRLPHGVTRART
ncbi:hypothetical protein ACOCJ5_07275 [Knoellia sp. CPCC 206450]|uniref:hypothetical protein n=1 Tax=Knoellia tibetensis TaxID=3404798 RepID=UPI003B42C021